ncbi:MAG: chalcone isomerase family protein [Gemmataceae bacterium]|nr:chalcone isomerase family protein [Gemmataceae bacterium]
MRAACAVLASAALAGAVWAGEMVGVPGGTAQFVAVMETMSGTTPMKLNLTGVAMRTKLILNIYAIGSYAQEGCKAKTAEELAAADCVKRLHLVMERTVDGKDLGEAFRSAVRLNHPEPEFKEEVNTLAQYMRTTSLRKGEHLYLTHAPGLGLHISVAGKADFLIKNPKFSQAVWEIYLGKKNIGEQIKTGLASRL